MDHRVDAHVARTQFGQIMNRGGREQRAVRSGPSG